jgi:hypothetical protein
MNWLGLDAAYLSWCTEYAESCKSIILFRDRGVTLLFVSAGDSPHLIKDVPFLLERKRLSTTVGAVDNQVVVAAHNARE